MPRHPNIEVCFNEQSAVQAFFCRILHSSLVLTKKSAPYHILNFVQATIYNAYSHSTSWSRQYNNLINRRPLSGYISLYLINEQRIKSKNTDMGLPDIAKISIICEEDHFSFTRFEEMKLCVNRAVCLYPALASICDSAISSFKAICRQQFSARFVMGKPNISVHTIPMAN